jgi:hypothetical protein
MGDSGIGWTTIRSLEAGRRESLRHGGMPGRLISVQLSRTPESQLQSVDRGGNGIDVSDGVDVCSATWKTKNVATRRFGTLGARACTAASAEASPHRPSTVSS